MTNDKTEQLTVEVQSGNSKIKFNTGITIAIGISTIVLGISSLFGLGMVWQQVKDTQMLAKNAATREEVDTNRAIIKYNTARIDSLNVWMTRQNKIAREASERNAERFEVIMDRLKNIERITIGHDLGSQSVTPSVKRKPRDWNPIEQVRKKGSGE